MLGTRVVVGTVLAVLALLVTIHGGLWFFTMIVLLGLLGLNECYRMLRRYRPLALAGLAAIVLMLCGAWFWSPISVLGASAAGLLFAFLLAMAPGPRPGVSVRIAVTMLGLAWVGWGLSSLLLIRGLPDPEPAMHYGAWLTGMVVFGTWAGDTLAYFTGRYFGATPMAPRLSPKKTWEGFVGGFIGTVLLVVLLGLYAHIPPSHSLLLGLTIGAAGPLGDLFESLLKRDVHMKDAGRFFPGHGGILDRFDALLFAAMASYFVITGLF